MALEIRPVTGDRWPELEELFARRGPRGGAPITATCWCMFWRERSGDAQANRAAMRQLVCDGHEPGLLACVDGKPVGWVSVGPRDEFGQLLRSRSYSPRDDDEDVHAIVCFYVDPRWKRRGIASALLDAAVDYAASRGAASIEAYPKDPADYMGSRTSFASAGFQPVREAGRRTVMRRGCDTT
jgi:GNAT superfamily N-acetyltransferase